MKWLRLLCVVLLFMYVSQGAVVAAPSYIPQKVLDSIQASQGQVIVKIPQADGSYMAAYLSGVLVKDDIVITAEHGLPDQIDLIYSPKKTTITFNGVPAHVKSYHYHGDVAILQLEKPILGMKPMHLAEHVEMYDMVYAQLYGYFPSGRRDGEWSRFTGLPFMAHVVQRTSVYADASILGSEFIATEAEYFYLDNEAKVGFSGGAFVDANGNLVGIGSFGDGGFTGIVSVDFIRTLLRASELRGSAELDTVQDTSAVRAGAKRNQAISK